jgi:hypothetical protein
MAAAMFKGWQDFYLIVGPSAAALIGLMFVVVTLTTARDPQQLELGKHLYTSPIVWHLGVVLLLSCGAIAPSVTPRIYGMVTVAAALVGLGFGLRSAIGIHRTQLTGADSRFDMWWYGLVPALAYLALGGSGVFVLFGKDCSATAIAASLLGLLFASIHAEWDLVTFLAPRANKDRG